MEEMIKLLEEIFDLNSQWLEMQNRQQILLRNRVSAHRGMYKEINLELRKIADECNQIVVRLAKAEKALEEC